MEELKKELDSKVTLDNLCSKEIIELSQELDKKVVEAQKRIMILEPKGILFDIANLTEEQRIVIATRATNSTLERMDNLEGGLTEISEEEMQKEISHILTDQSMGYDQMKTFENIIPLGADLDNGFIYDLATGKTIKEL